MSTSVKSHVAVIVTAGVVAALSLGLGAATLKSGGRSSTTLAAQATASPAEDDEAQVRNTAREAIVAFHSVFIAPRPDSAVPGSSPISAEVAKKVAAPLTASEAQDADGKAIAYASSLFTGQPLSVLTQAIPRAMALAVPSSDSADAGAGTSNADNYSVCVDGGASDFKFQNVSISGDAAEVDVIARVWQTTVDNVSGQPAQVARAVETYLHKLELVRTDQGWRVSKIEIEPVPA